MAVAITSGGLQVAADLVAVTRVLLVVHSKRMADEVLGYYDDGVWHCVGREGKEERSLG